MARESSLWSWLSKARFQAELVSRLHINRVENSVMAGMPDVEGFLRVEEWLRAAPGMGSTSLLSEGGQFWLELKSAERPARASTPIRFKLRDREAQIEWMNRRWELGGNAFWLLQVGSGSERRLYLAPGPLGPELHRGLTEAELAIHCVNYGVFSKKSISQKEILKRVLTCRNRQSLMRP